MKLRDRAAAERAGRAAEDEAAAWLKARGWTILATRARTRGAGEVDLVARKPGLLAFVEVKARATPAELDLALDRRRLVRVAAAAESLIPRYAEPDDTTRIDAILLCPGHPPRHLENVWEG